MRFAIVAAGALAASAVMFSVSSARADDSGNMDDKKIVLGADLQFVLPLNSDFSNVSGPMIGPLVHFGYRLTPPLELTARAGYLFGLSKSQSSSPLGNVSTSISDLPIMVGARYYFGVGADAPAGLYAGAEIGFNFLNGCASVAGASSCSGSTREGFNVGAGYVISQSLPIDIRAQFMYFNLLGTNSGENGEFGLGLSAGYSFFL